MANTYVAVDVGGTKILAAVVTSTGSILARYKTKTERRSKKRLLEQIDESIVTVLEGAGLAASDISGIALGVPGVVDTATGSVVHTPNAPLSKTPLRSLVTQRFGVPTAVGNDVNLGVLGEYWLGAARNATSAYGIFVGTGIGGGLVIDGKLIEGYRGMGGEIGHLMVPLGADEIAGMLERKHSFLEDLCSRTAIENQLRHAILKDKKPSLLVDIVAGKSKGKKSATALERIRSGALREALKRRDPLVTEVIRNASYLLGLASASVLHVVDPEVIVFGGGVIEACGDWMLPLIEKTVRKVAIPGNGRPLKIVRSHLGDDAIIMGGVALLQSQRVAGEASLTIHVDAAPVDAMRRPVAQIDKPLGVAA